MSLIFGRAQADNDQTVTIQFNQAVENTWAVLAGFETGFGSSAYEVQTISARLNESGSSAPDTGLCEVTAEVTIEDNDGHKDGGTLYIMGIGQTKDDRTQFRSVPWNPSHGEHTETIHAQGAPLEYAWVFIRGFNLTYGNRSQYEVRTIEIDAGNTTLQLSSVLDSGGKSYTWYITFTPKLVMDDDSNHVQTDDSALDLLVMAVPAADSGR